MAALRSSRIWRQPHVPQPCKQCTDWQTSRFFLWFPINISYDFLSSSCQPQTLSFTEVDCRFQSWMQIRDSHIHKCPLAALTTAPQRLGPVWAPGACLGWVWGKNACVSGRDTSPQQRLWYPVVLVEEVQPSWNWSQPLGARELPNRDHKHKKDFILPLYQALQGHQACLSILFCRQSCLQSHKNFVVESWKRDKIKPNCMLS